MSRALVVVPLSAVLLSSAAETQPLYTLQDMMNMAISQCISARPAQPDAQRFCTCWVNRWVGLWSANDRITWTQTGAATPHMADMERVAASQCGG